MNQVYKDNVINWLFYLADYDYQKRVWVEGKDRPGDMSSSFVEGCCMVFDDTGLGDALDAGETVFGAAADQAIRDLSEATDKVDYKNKPDSMIINTPAMQVVREKAAKALRLVVSSNANASTVALIVNIYIKVSSNGDTILRPALAYELPNNLFKVYLTGKYILNRKNPPDERWEFTPGDIVLCQRKTLNGAHVLVAIAKA